MKSNVTTFEPSNVRTLVSANNLSKSFGETHAVDDVSLQVKAGEIYGLVGPDGAGKTTTLRLICCAQRAQAGAVVDPPDEVVVGGVGLEDEGRAICWLVSDEDVGAIAVVRRALRHQHGREAGRLLPALTGRLG